MGTGGSLRFTPASVDANPGTSTTPGTGTGLIDGQGKDMSQRFRRLTDLFVTGKAVRLPDGSHLWVQAINAYERDECVSDAQVARARLVLALRENGSERAKIEARMAERGRDAMVIDLAAAKTEAKYGDVVADIEADPDWRERVEIMRRHDPAQAAAPMTEEEEALVRKINDDWFAEIARRIDDEQSYQVRHYTRVDDEELLADYLDAWLERRGSDVAAAEYSLTEMWYASRYCEATEDDGALDHSRCEGHPTRVFDTKGDARSAPDPLRDLLMSALTELAMAGRDPKGSDSPASSSDSSPTPSERAASTPSTSGETPDAVPGT